MDIAAAGGAHARIDSCAFQPVEPVKALHAQTAVVILLSLKKT